ncbi:MAG: GTP 3',8-cyclase MoaA [Candidatus Brockarchaeota archaeon]|nr:GTP 3',8-cyclase MoaA [Candidatus Brockarchaeota archaeon]
MLDAYGREVSSLRISVTQECNLSCFFCHREGECSAPSERMSVGEILKLVEVGRMLGVEKVKVTGGEPLLRPDIVEVVRGISALVEEVSLVTNGLLLRRFAGELREAGLRRVNVSLHSLDRRNYRAITGADRLEEAKDGIDAALENGLKPLKLNAVVLKGLNDSEIWDMVDFAFEKGAVLQLIELQAIGGGGGGSGDAEGWFKERYVDLSQIESALRKKAAKVLERDFQRRRKYFLRRGAGEAEVEVVKPTHNSKFCMGCTRLRATSDGRLKPCLMRTDNLVEFASLVRAGAGERELVEAYLEAVRRREPFWKG